MRSVPTSVSCSVVAPLAAALVSLAAWSLPAYAEDKNPAKIACDGKAEGDACTITRQIKNNEGQPDTRESPGVCQPEECCEQDYSKGSPPEVTCGPCLACKASGPRPTPDAPEVTADGEASPAEAGGEPPRNAADPPPSAPNDKRGCRIGGSPGAPAIVGLLALLGLVVRRRR
ncbi:MAG: MYXO-CTERM sorting domain-containing protein [Myxococcota bacterium]